MHLPESFDERGRLQAVVETPKGSHFKYDYDSEKRVFVIKKSLPKGMEFPENFGFIPKTLGEDGDPLDIIILSDYPLEMGSVALVVLLGVLEAEQVEVGASRPIRNDRLVGYLINEDDETEAFFHSVAELPQPLKNHLELFFVHFAEAQRKVFKPLHWYGPNHAKTLVEMGMSAAQSKL